MNIKEALNVLTVSKKKYGILDLIVEDMENLFAKNKAEVFNSR